MGRFPHYRKAVNLFPCIKRPRRQALDFPTHAQRLTPLIPRRVFFGNPDKASPQVSPDGSQLSFLAPDNGVLNVWVAPADDPAAARPVTRDTGRGVRLYGWTYKSHQIAYLQDSNGDENWHIYAVNLETDEIRDLTRWRASRLRLTGTAQSAPTIFSSA